MTNEHKRKRKADLAYLLNRVDDMTEDQLAVVAAGLRTNLNKEQTERVVAVLRRVAASEDRTNKTVLQVVLEDMLDWERARGADLDAREEATNIAIALAESDT